MGEVLFLSYASPDRDRVEPFFDALERMGFNPWMDCRMLRAGQNWDFEIQRALDQAKIVLVFLSENSVDRRGYLQREIKIAVRKLEEKLIDDVYIIPVALDSVARPAQLKDIQFVNAAASDCLEEIRLSVSEQLLRLGTAEARGSEIKGVRYRKTKYTDSYDGIPGYVISADFVAISSEEYPNLKNASDVISGAISRSIMASRDCVTSPNTSVYNIGQARWSRTNTLDWVLSEVGASGRVLSVVYTMHYYFAGAAHPISGFRTFNFYLSPVMEIENFKALIEDESCLPMVQSKARAQLCTSLRGASEAEPDEDWIATGTNSWDCFNSFSIRGEDIAVHFGSYQVAPYAFGHQTVSVPARDLAPYMTEFAANSLDLGWVRRNAREKPAS